MPSEIFRVLSDPTRRAVFEQLATREMTVSELTEAFPVSQPAVSQHLAALKSAGLVQERREGRFSHYRADPAGLQPLMEWIARYRGLWSEHVGELQLILDELDN